MKKLLHIVLCFLLIASLPVQAFAAGGVPAEVIAAKDSVVRVLAEYQDGYATGSGFVVQSDRSATLIVTNYHVVEGHPHSISVWLGEEETVSASILTYTDQKDMCVLKLAYPVQIQTVSFAKSGARQGDAVYAVGFPGAADILSDKDAHTSADATITDGIVSAVREATVSEHGSPTAILQVNAAINHGNSGGPLFNAKGEVVGIATYGIGDAQGIFGAISVSELLDFLADSGISTNTEGKSGNWIVFALIGVAAVAAAAAVFFGLKRKKKSRSAQPVETAKSLRDYMSEHADGLGAEEAVALLLPVAIQLRDLHNDGKVHLQVSNDSIRISSSGASLMDPTGSEANRYASGFAAPEIYKGTTAGNLSDIYSFCAVLSYVASGKVPMNALSRVHAGDSETGEDLPDHSEDAFAAIVNKGMDLSPEQRFSSMQNLILKLSPFNTKPFSGPVEIQSVPEQQPEKAPEKAKAHKVPIKLVSGIAAVVLLAALFGGYWMTYQKARSAAAEQNFQQAEKNLLVPQITKLHDARLLTYIEAGKLMDARQYDEAKSAFASVLEYLDAEELMLECDYRHAAQYADANEFSKAAALFSSLEEKQYKDAGKKVLETQYRNGIFLMNEQQKYNDAYLLFDSLEKKGYQDATLMKDEARYQWALALIESGDYLLAYEKLESIPAYSDVPEILPALKELMYDYGQSLYRQGDYEEAEPYFDCIDSFRDTSAYLTLIELHLDHYFFDVIKFDLSYPLTLAKEYYEKLSPLFDFEDTTEVITKYLLAVHLQGTWSGDGYSFTLGKDGSCSYTLPSSDYGDHFYLSEGKFYTYPNNWDFAAKPMFSFTLVSRDCIKVFCYQDSKTYTLYRQ